MEEKFKNCLGENWGAQHSPYKGVTYGEAGWTVYRTHSDNTSHEVGGGLDIKKSSVQWLRSKR